MRVFDSVGVWVRVVLVGLVVALAATVTPAVGPTQAQQDTDPSDGGEAVVPEVFEPGEVNRRPVGSRPSEPPPGWDPDVPADVEAGEEVVGLRSASSKTFAGDGGGMVTEVFDAPVHHETEPGVFVELDRTLTVAGGAQARSATVVGDGPVSVQVPERLSDGAVTVADDAGGQVGFTVQGASDSGVDASGERAVYRDAFDGVDVELAGTGFGVKELLVLDGPEAVRSFEFGL